MVFTPDGPREADVRVADGVITEVERSAAGRGARVIDVSGMYVLPGAIDVHVHSRDPGFPDKEDFGTLTSAAAAGGVTRRDLVAGAGAAAAALVAEPALAFAGGAGGVPIYRIHPAIGVARLGNADPSTFFIGPEAPAVPQWLRRAPLDGGFAAEEVDADGRARANGGDAALSGLLAWSVWYAVNALGEKP